MKSMRYLGFATWAVVTLFVSSGCEPEETLTEEVSAGTSERTSGGSATGSQDTMGGSPQSTAGTTAGQPVPSGGESTTRSGGTEAAGGTDIGGRVVMTQGGAMAAGAALNRLAQQQVRLRPGTVGQACKHRRSEQRWRLEWRAGRRAWTGGRHAIRRSIVIRWTTCNGGTNHQSRRSAHALRWPACTGWSAHNRGTSRQCRSSRDRRRTHPKRWQSCDGRDRRNRRAGPEWRICYGRWSRECGWRSTGHDGWTGGR